MLKKMLDALKIRAVIVSGGFGRAVLPLAEKIDAHDRQSEYVDLLLHRDDGWYGYNTLWRAGLKALEASMGKGATGGSPLEQKSVLVLGNGGVAQSMAHAAAERKALVSVCGPNSTGSPSIR